MTRPITVGELGRRHHAERVMVARPPSTSSAPYHPRHHRHRDAQVEDGEVGDGGRQRQQRAAASDRQRARLT